MICPKCNTNELDELTNCPQCGIIESHFFNEKQEFQFSTKATVWFTLCSIFSLITGIPYILNNLNGKNMIFVLLGVLALTTSFTYFQLMRKKVKLAFYVIVAICIVAFLINIYLGIGATSFIGLVNPIITYLIISKHWEHLK